MACKRRILCPLSVVMIIVAFLQASGTIFRSSVAASSSDLILIVQTESPFYGSGEVVKIRGNLTDTNGTAIQGAKIAVEVRSPRNNTIFIDIVFTSIDGTFEDSFRLDKTAILGDYFVYGTANAIGYPATTNQTAFMVVTVANLSEKTFIASDLNETVLLQNATINNAEVQGDLSGALSFTSFEMVQIATGPFAGKGFSKGTWEATLEGISYKGAWRGAFYFVPSDRRIYLKGAVSGEMTGVAEGYVSESFAQSGVYDRYLATWKIGRLGSAIFSATLSLNGTLVYHGYSEFPFTGLCILQTSIEGSASGHYNCSLSSTLTQIRVSANSPFIGEGFSIISYSSNYGMGEGWTYDRLASPGTVEMKGFLTSPLYGIVHATLNETTLPRSLHMYIERVDLGLPPTADVKVILWGPGRVSPGQTVTYGVEIRNDGLKSAENSTVVLTLPDNVTYRSSTGIGFYGSRFSEVIWRFDSIPAKSLRHETAAVVISNGLPSGTIIQPILAVQETQMSVTDPDVSVAEEILRVSQTHAEMKNTISKASTSSVLDALAFVVSFVDVIEPSFVKQIVGDETTITYEFTVGGARVEEFFGVGNQKVWGIVRGVGSAVSLGLELYHLREDKKEVTEAREKMQDILQWAALEAEYPISPESYKLLSDIMKSKSLCEYIIPNALSFIPFGFGDVLHEAATGAFKSIDRIFLHSLYTRMMIDSDGMGPATFEEFLEQYYDTRSGAISSMRSSVVVARDPNVKYGFEGYVFPGQSLNYAVEYENEGEGSAYGVYFTDTLDWSLNDSSLQIGPVVSTSNGSIIADPGTYNPSTRTITWLVGEVGPNEGGVANFSVKVRNDAPEGTEIINSATVYFPSVPETTRTNTIVSVVGQPNIAVKDLTPLETSAKIGSILYLNATVANEGYFAETVNITLYANSTTIGTQNITLTGRSENTVIFIWNTTNSLIGNYTISAYVWPVPGETNTVDNTFVDGLVVVTSHGWELDFAASTRHPIVDFAVYNGSLYAVADNKLYVKDGSSWNVVDAPTFVTSLEPYGGKLVVGGQGGLYCYDGTSFNLIFSVPTYIKVLGAYNNTLYAGTFLDKPPILYYCNGNADNPDNWHIDTSFSVILNFSGPFGSVDSFAEYDGNLYVTSGGNIYSYNETGWNAVKTFDDVYGFSCMQAYNDKLYLATRDQGWRKPLYQGGTGFGGRVIEYDGQNWTTVLEHDYWIYSLEEYDGKLYAGTANKILTYNGTYWGTSFNATEGAYYAISMTTFDGKIYAGMGNGYILADPAPPKTYPETVTVPEFSSTTILAVFMALTMLAPALTRKNRSKRFC